MSDEIRVRRGPTLQRPDGWYAVVAYGPFETQEQADNFSRWMTANWNPGGAEIAIDAETLTAGEWAGQ